MAHRAHCHSLRTDQPHLSHPDPSFSSSWLWTSPKPSCTHSLHVSCNMQLPLYCHSSLLLVSPRCYELTDWQCCCMLASAPAAGQQIDLGFETLNPKPNQRRKDILYTQHNAHACAHLHVPLLPVSMRHLSLFRLGISASLPRSRVSHTLQVTLVTGVGP